MLLNFVNVASNNWRITSLTVIFIIIFICKMYTEKVKYIYINQEIEKEGKLKLNKVSKVNKVSIENFNSLIPKYLIGKEENELDKEIVPKIPHKKRLFTKEYNIRYMDSEDGYDIFKDNQYLETMSMINVQARGYNNKALMTSRYMNCLLNISNDEEKNVNKFINAIIEKIITNIKISDDLSKQISSSGDASIFSRWIINTIQNTKISKGDKWLENGMPHTHSNIIFFPESWFNEINNASNNNFINDNIFLYNAGTLIHELVHIHQRIRYGPYMDLYKKWGFIKASYIDNFEGLKARSRHNPDGKDVLWIWKNPKTSLYYWIGAVFKNMNPNNLGAVELEAYPVVNTGSNNFKLLEHQSPYKLNEFNDFHNYFLLDNNNYHPNELVAGYMEIYYHTLLGKRTHLNCDGYKAFLTVVKEITK